VQAIASFERREFGLLQRCLGVVLSSHHVAPRGGEEGPPCLVLQGHSHEALSQLNVSRQIGAGRIHKSHFLTYGILVFIYFAA